MARNEKKHIHNNIGGKTKFPVVKKMILRIRLYRIVRFHNLKYEKLGKKRQKKVWKTKYFVSNPFRESFSSDLEPQMISFNDHLIFVERFF